MLSGYRTARGSERVNPALMRQILSGRYRSPF